MIGSILTYISTWEMIRFLWRGDFVSNFFFQQLIVTCAYHPKGEMGCNLGWKMFFLDRHIMTPFQPRWMSLIHHAILAFVHDRPCLIGCARWEKYRHFRYAQSIYTSWFLKGMYATSRLAYCTVRFAATTQHDRDWFITCNRTAAPAACFRAVLDRNGPFFTWWCLYFAFLFRRD